MKQFFLKEKEKDDKKNQLTFSHCEYQKMCVFLKNGRWYLEKTTQIRKDGYAHPQQNKHEGGQRSLYLNQLKTRLFKICHVKENEFQLEFISFSLELNEQEKKSQWNRLKN